MTVRSAEDLPGEWALRAAYFGDDHELMDKLVNLYYGGLPPEFDDYFDPEMHVHLVNMIRLAWDDLAALAGKVFPIYVRPDNEKPTARQRAEKQEQIAYGWNRAGQIVGGVSRDLLQKVVAWWMVGCANAVVMTLPDYKHKTPYYTFRDPRTHYPPIGWSPYTQAGADDALFAYQLSIGELKRRYPARNDEINQKLSRMVSGRFTTSGNDSDAVWVGEYYHEDVWSVSTLTDNTVILEQSQSGDRGHPGVQPVTAMGLYTPVGAKGRSMFADQISIQAAMARMFSQKLDFFDRTLYPLVFHTRLAGQTIKVGPFATNEYDVTDGVAPRVDTVAPAHQVDADQTMAFALGLSRMLNRNPESMQGAGAADSSKALETLKQGVVGTIRDGIWPPMLEAEPHLMSNAAKIDIALWPNVKKSATGKGKNSAFRVSYVPTVDLRNREFDFEAQAGLGVAGYQGTIEILQLLGAEQISEETALEQRDDIPDAEKEKRRIEADRIKKLLRADLASRAQAAGTGQPGALAPGALAEILRRVESGEDLYAVLEDMDKAGRLTVQPPQMPEAGPPGALPGMGGPSPAGPPGPMPSLGMLRGAPGA